MNLKIEFARKTALAYTAVCRPLCQEMKLPQTAFDILMFLYNNPEYKTARDIVEIRNIKANLVSVNVEKLVQDGYIERQAVEKRPPQNGADLYAKGAAGSETGQRAAAGVCREADDGLE